MSVLTLHFKESVLSETGEDTGKVKSLEILGVFVEGSALVAGLSEEVTAIIPLAEISWASVYEGSVDASDEGDDNRSEGSSADAESESENVSRPTSESTEGAPAATVLKPDFTGGGKSS